MRAAAWIACGLLLAALGVRLTAELLVDEEYVATRLARGLVGRYEGPEVAVEKARFRPFRRSLTVRGLTAVVSEDSLPGAGREGGGRLHWRLAVPRATVTAIGLAGLVGEGLSARKLEVESPRLFACGDRGTDTPCRGPRLAGQSAYSAGERSRAGEPGPAPSFRLERVSVTGGTLGLDVPTRSTPLGGRANGVDLELTDFELRGASGSLLPAVLGSVARLRVPSFLVRDPAGSRRLSVRDLEVDLGEGTARVGQVRFLESEMGSPDALPPDVKAAPADTTALRTSGLTLDGVALDTAGGRRRLSARSLRVGRFRLHVVDAVLPGASVEGRLPRTPVQHLRALDGVTGRVDSARLARGSVRYTERRPGRVGTGTILFDRLEATAEGVPFGARPSSVTDTVRVSVSGRIAATAPLWLRASFPDRADALSFEAHGGTRDLELSALNSIFRPIEGIEITGGRLDSLRFSIVARDGHASGRVAPVYDGLGLSLEDPRTGGRGLDEHLRGFVLGLRLNARNHPADGDDYRTGTIDHRAPRGQTFPAFLWQALLTGLRDVAGI